MPQPDDGLNFSHKGERVHTIEKPHSAPFPTALQEWLVNILRRLVTPASSGDNNGEDGEEEEK